jgi:NADPH:quinone reductase-like Zn-dependent oxidoreductase/DNA-binding SARP family transcriptional activator
MRASSREKPDGRRRPTASLSINVLGRLSVSADGQPVSVTTSRLRALLVALALSADEEVSVDRLADIVWDDTPPVHVRRATQVYVTRLRKLLGPQVIISSPAGYRLHVDPEQVDAILFERLLDAAALGDPAAERAGLERALALWRGIPFDGVRSAWLESVESHRLTERYMTAQERRIGLDLDLGQSAELVAELLGLTARYPLRERLWGHLITALWRSGQQAEALAAYQRLYRLLADELGIEPSHAVQALHRQILTSQADTAIRSTTSSPRSASLRRTDIAPRQVPAERLPGAERVRRSQPALPNGNVWHSSRISGPLSPTAARTGISPIWNDTVRRMWTMDAAVIRGVGLAPEFARFDDPEPRAGEVLLTVKAAALNPSTRATASGTHYAGRTEFPYVAGLDGVGVQADGRRVYFGGPREPFGTFAQRTVTSRARCWPVPDGVDDVTAAALPNPALSSWLPMVHQAKVEPGQTVLVLGATGTAGRLAIQIAKLLGAGRVVAAGRSQSILATLPSLGADATIQLDQPYDQLVEEFSEEPGFHLVLDFVWGRPTEALLAALTRPAFDADAFATKIVQIGDGAGPTITLPAAALRSAGLTIVGTGMPPYELFLDTFSKAMHYAANGTLKIDTAATPLTQITTAWTQGDTDGGRIVIVP